MLPGVGVFGTGSTARVLVPLLKAEGFEVHALWGQSEDEARCLAQELAVPFHTSRSDDVLLHQDVDLVCIYIPPSMTRQIAVKALGEHKRRSWTSAKPFNNTRRFPASTSGEWPHP